MMLNVNHGRFLLLSAAFLLPGAPPAWATPLAKALPTAPIARPRPVAVAPGSAELLARAVAADLDGNSDLLFTQADLLLKRAPRAAETVAIQILLKRHFRSVPGGRQRFFTWLEKLNTLPNLPEASRVLTAFNLADQLPVTGRLTRRAALLGMPKGWAVSPVRGDFTIHALLHDPLPDCAGSLPAIPPAAPGAPACAVLPGWRWLDFGGASVRVYQPAFTQSGVAWAVTEVNLDAPRLLVYQGSAARLWVDGAEFLQHQSFDRYQGDFSLARLPAGTHRIAVKFLVEEPGDSFDLALLPLATGTAGASRPAPEPAPLTRAMLASALGNDDESREILLNTLARPALPAATRRLLRWRLALSYRQNALRLMPGKLAEEKERTLIEQLLAEKPTARLHMRLAEILENNENPQEATRQYEAALALAPQRAELQLNYAEFLERRGFKSESHARRNLAEPLAAGREAPLVRLLDTALKNSEVIREERLAAAVYRLDPENDMLEQRLRRRDPEAMLKQQLEKYAGQADPLHELAAYFAGLEDELGRPEAALKRLRAAYAPGPVEGGARALEAQYLAASGARGAALKIFRDLAGESAQADTAREALAAAGESEPVFAWRQNETQRRTALSRPAGPAEMASEYLLDWTADYLYPDKTRRSIYHSLTRVLTAEGVERESKVRIPEGARVLRLLVIKKDGRELEPGEPEGDHFLMPDLEPGDIIEQEYLETGVRGTGAGSLKAGAVDNRRIFLFNSNQTRTRRSEQYMVGPGMEECEVLTGNGVNDLGDAKPGRHFRIDEPVRFPPEPNRPPERMYLPWAGANCGNRLDDALLFWEGALRWRTRSSTELRALANRLAAGTKNEDEKISRLFEFLRAEIRGEWQFAFEDPAYILHDQRGNRLLVARAILQIWAIPHEYWLAADTNDYEASVKLPSPTLFGQPQLIKLNWRGESRFIVLGSEYGAPDLLPDDISGAHAVVIGADHQARFDRLPDFPDDGTLVEETRQMGPDGVAEVSGRMLFSQLLSASMRSQIVQLPVDKRGPVFEKVVQNIVPGIELESADMTGLDGFSQPAALVYSGKLRGATQVSRGLQLPQPAGESGVNELARLPTRVLPLWFDPSRDVEKLRVTLLPPVGMTIEAPAPLTLDLPGIKYRLEYISLPDGGLRYERDYQRTGLKLDPADYPAWAEKIRRSKAAEQLRPLLIRKD